MSRTLFISDLHLDPARPEVTRALAAFLSQHADCDALYILGDLFEAWPGDDDDSPLALEVTALLRDFRAAGPALLLMHGNRDFLLGEAFCRDTGASLLQDPSLIDLCGETTLLMHGDSLCIEDRDYQAFRQTSRNSHWQAQLLARGLDERRQLASQLRGMSTEAKAGKAEQIMDVTPQEVDRVMREYGASRLIHGHTHRPGSHRVAAGSRWVLGEWAEQAWYIAATKEDIQLKSHFIS